MNESQSWSIDWQRLQQHLDSQPGDLLARLALADILEEQGQLIESRFQRWLVRQQCWPDGDLSVFHQVGWHWWSSVGESSQHRSHAQLPATAQAHMPVREWLYSSRRDAEQELFEALLQTNLLHLDQEAVEPAQVDLQN